MTNKLIFVYSADGASSIASVGDGQQKWKTRRIYTLLFFVKEKLMGVL